MRGIFKMRNPLFVMLVFFFEWSPGGGEVPHLNIFEKKGQTPDVLQQSDR
jgi:hypothetical protein